MDNPGWFWTVLVLVLVVSQCACQQTHYLVRPVPSDTLPVLDLQEDPDPLLDPQDQDLNQTELRSLLGGFDPLAMSLSPPEDSGTTEDLEDSGPEPTPRDLLRVLELRVLQSEVQPGPGPGPGRRLLRRLQVLLRSGTGTGSGTGSWTGCALRESWTDLGIRFWPRYLKVGSCSRIRSCSVPEGMFCRPSRSRYRTVLRWSCTRRRRGRGGLKGLRCNWIRIHYPVITQCTCSCRDT
ncbi:noggin-3 [Sebastes umbrosus]|uniref:noggin-3 n=1 Tax=Sebastes umbrosus TaxID=72105 RepID=UPI0018A09BAD|nr:noggin-3 [Sebastes umbrosus]